MQTTTIKKKGRALAQDATQTIGTNDAALILPGATLRNDKSTSCAAQQHRILEALTMRPHTSYELRKLGCYQAPARIIELRRRGHKISTKRVTIWDDEGFRHDGVALYTLHEKKNDIFPSNYSTACVRRRMP
ncbi:helix-turn-helix domain-containing protein [Achromobacter insolitus]|uniref:helix-turn-helix domain-containing protein n=1 Tax=Achromobacter insolitus TaxID=217204 RepID=UPI0007C2403E|nr:helix-turn-helix domain-containing protein [Achromobacter insolitus]OAD17024.1 hypothetical protein A3839_25500 [Achromobacter insolitus]